MVIYNCLCHYNNNIMESIQRYISARMLYFLIQRNALQLQQQYSLLAITHLANTFILSINQQPLLPFFNHLLIQPKLILVQDLPSAQSHNIYVQTKPLLKIKNATLVEQQYFNTHLGNQFVLIDIKLAFIQSLFIQSIVDFYIDDQLLNQQSASVHINKQIPIFKNKFSIPILQVNPLIKYINNQELTKYEVIQKSKVKSIEVVVLTSVLDIQAAKKQCQKLIFRQLKLKNYKSFIIKYPNILPTQTNTQLLPTLDTYSQFPPKYLLKPISPHLHMPTKFKPYHKTYLVQSPYLYYHYLHDEQQDIGWGCAYRACQTLISWHFIKEGSYQDIPSIEQIQCILQRIENKKYKGTNKWIGALQVSWIINKVCNTQCKIIHISEGCQIRQKLRQIQYHFQMKGSPIMYGGGKYAYTIVGMTYDQQTGTCQFLILDPHYSGKDKPKNIIQKGIQWKSLNIFQDKQFYNLCLPQLQ